MIYIQYIFEARLSLYTNTDNKTDAYVNRIIVHLMQISLPLQFLV